MKFSVSEYLTADGRSPFREWLDSLSTPVRARIQVRVLRFEMGNLGDHKSAGQGVVEARLAFGPGYRIYFGLQGRTAVLLLLGGDKASQAKDIRRATQYWAEFLEATKHGKAK